MEKEKKIFFCFQGIKKNYITTTFQVQIVMRTSMHRLVDTTCGLLPFSSDHSIP